MTVKPDYHLGVKIPSHRPERHANDDGSLTCGDRAEMARTFVEEETQEQLQGHLLDTLHAIHAAGFDPRPMAFEAVRAFEADVADEEDLRKIRFSCEEVTETKILDADQPDPKVGDMHMLPNPFGSKYRFRVTEVDGNTAKLECGRVETTFEKRDDGWWWGNWMGNLSAVQSARFQLKPKED
jgi:hypothetical protein